MRDFNIFIIKVYIPKWFTCQIATFSPRNDLQLLKDIIAHKEINSIASQAATKSFSNHLWYLSDTLIALAFFDRELSNEVKVAMINKLKDPKTSTATLRKAKITGNVETINLEDFVSEHTNKFFTILFGNIPQFLKKHPSTWFLDEEYLKIEEIVKHQLVVNDVAERGIKLITDFNTILSKDEDQKQYILQTVENHRKKIQNLTKIKIQESLTARV